MRRVLLASVVLSILLMSQVAVGDGLNPPPVWHDGFTNPLLPPIHPNPAIAYYGHDLHAMYPQGVIMQDPIHRAFTNVQRSPIGLDEVEVFDSVLDATVSADGGVTWVSITMTGPVTTKVYNYTSGQTGTFDTEILSMNLVGNVGGYPVMIRESPTRSSTGRVSVEGGGGGGGGYRIESFFDVFTELSIDGGQSWGPDLEAPGRMTLCPEPATLGLVALGGLALLRRRR